jgi:hypothetical protein
VQSFYVDCGFSTHDVHQTDFPLLQKGMKGARKFLLGQCYVTTYRFGLTTGRHTAQSRTYLSSQQLFMQ